MRKPSLKNTSSPTPVSKGNISIFFIFSNNFSAKSKIFHNFFLLNSSILSNFQGFIIKLFVLELICRFWLMMSRSSSSSTTTCNCCVTVAKVRSWTKDNPGRLFLGFKFYNLDIGHRGCKMFSQEDNGSTYWQRDVIINLVMKKKTLTHYLKLKEELGMVKDEKTKFCKEFERLKRKVKKPRSPTLRKGGKKANAGKLTFWPKNVEVV